MTSFVCLTGRDGRKWRINPTHIVAYSTGGTGTDVYLSTSTSLEVVEQPAAITALLLDPPS